MIKLKLKQIRSERGVALVEVLVGIILLSVVLLGLAAAAAHAIRQTTRGRQDLQIWAAVQRTADSLVLVGWGNVTTGSGVTQGHKMWWTVTGTDPERIDLEVERQNLTTGQAVRDTLVLYLTDPNS